MSIEQEIQNLADKMVEGMWYAIEGDYCTKISCELPLRSEFGADRLLLGKNCDFVEGPYDTLNEIIDLAYVKLEFLDSEFGYKRFVLYESDGGNTYFLVSLNIQVADRPPPGLRYIFAGTLVDCIATLQRYHNGWPTKLAQENNPWPTKLAQENNPEADERKHARHVSRKSTTNFNTGCAICEISEASRMEKKDSERLTHLKVARAYLDSEINQLEEKGE